jgi:hypothetical protein
MSTKARAPDANPLTDVWKPDHHEVMIMFTFDPYAPENEEGLTHGVVRAKCNLIEHDCAENLDLEKCLVLAVDVLSSTGSVGTPLAPLFFSMNIGREGESQIRSCVAGSDGKYPLALAGTHPALFRRKADDACVELGRRDFGKLSDENVADYLDSTVKAHGHVTLPPALLEHVEGCFKSSENSLERTHRAHQATGGQFVLQSHEYMFCRDKIQELLAEVRESFDDATTVLAELSCCDTTKSIASLICDQPFYVVVKMTISCC